MMTYVTDGDLRKGCGILGTYTPQNFTGPS